MKRKGQRIHGWIALDKPEGLGSTQALAKVKWLFNAEKAGHGGTLDPLASGLLPIALGEATKTVSWAMDGRKIYRFTGQMGRGADDGRPRRRDFAPFPTIGPHSIDIESILPQFKAKSCRRRPTSRRSRLPGERAYDLARAGEAVELAPRPVIHRENRASGACPMPIMPNSTVTCGKGTYIRSLARDMALALGTVGHVARAAAHRRRAFWRKRHDFAGKA